MTASRDMPVPVLTRASLSSDRRWMDSITRTASLWSSKTFGLRDAAQLRLGAGVVYNGKSVSTSPIWSIVTPSRTTVDALAEISWNKWRVALNATNLLNNKYFASCLARGDCFVGAPRNVMATVGVRF